MVKRRTMAKTSDSKIALMIVAIIAVIAVVGLIMSLGLVKTGNGVKDEPLFVKETPTAAVCPPGSAQAYAHSDLHVALRKANMDCQSSMYPQYVCCFVP